MVSRNLQQAIVSFSESLTASFVARKHFKKVFYKVFSEETTKQINQGTAFLGFTNISITDDHNSMTKINDVYISTVHKMFNIDVQVRPR